MCSSGAHYIDHEELEELKRIYKVRLILYDDNFRIQT